VGLAGGEARGAAEGWGYAVVVSEATAKDPAWGKVVRALVSKHAGATIVHDGEVAGCLGELRRRFPKYACFVARPEEAGRKFVADVHRLTRKLDEDLYTDVLWGILTAYDANDAMRIASARGPLVIRTAGAGTGLNLDLFDAGKWFSEGKAGLYCQKAPGGRSEKKTGPADSTKAIVDFLNDEQPQLFITSGHATERDWQIGYSYRNGQLRCRDGKLYGRDTKRKEHAIDSPGAKVFLGAGNCLIGHVKDRQSMALAWLGSGGANQFVGYTAVTWYGAMGWGTKDWLLELPGRHSVTEAFYFANQHVVLRLATDYPKTGGAQFDAWDLHKDRSLLRRMSAKLGYRGGEKSLREHLGLLWDRDTVALYGDPAWEARLARRDLPWTTELTESGGRYTLRITSRKEGRPRKPLAQILPHRIADAKLIKGKQFAPVITDNFILLAEPGPLEAGKVYDIVFKARRR